MIEPLHVVLSRLMAEREMTAYAVARETRRRYGWGSAQTLGLAVRGRMVPGVEGLEYIAAVLEVEPEVFAEYRLAKRRRELDWKVVGLEAAVEALGE